MVIARHPQSNQNNKFAKPLQYLKKELNDVDFLPADKHQDFRQVAQLTFTCLKLTIETLGKGVKYVQS